MVNAAGTGPAREGLHPGVRHMALSKRSIEALLDLVEIKLGCMEVFDREDAKELAVLEACREELQALRALAAARKAEAAPARAPAEASRF